MSGQGIRIFKDDLANKAKGGTYTSSSNTGYAQYAFDNLKQTKWISDGEDSDSTEIYVERNFGTEKKLDSFFAYGTNLTDLVFEYWDSGTSTWIELDSSNTELLVSKENVTYNYFITSGGLRFRDSDGRYFTVGNTGEYYYFAKLTGSIFTEKIRAKGSITKSNNSEKYIKMFYAFEQLGQMEWRPELDIQFQEKENIMELVDSKSFVYKEGRSIVGALNFENHFNQNDLDLKQSMIELNTPLFIWKCGGDEAQFKYYEEGWKFEDIYKCSLIKGNHPILRKNRYNLAGNDKLFLVEVS